MLIFHNFPTRKFAEAFVASAGLTTHLTGSVHDTQEEADKVDPFPFLLTPPIALIERSEPHLEQYLCGLVQTYGGSFAGT